MLPCSCCHETSVYHERSTGKEFCKAHFCANFERSIQESVNLLGKENPRLAVYYSAGKDSTAILYVLKKILKYDVVAISADLGIPGYISNIVYMGKKICDDLGVEYLVVPLKDNLGVDLNDIVQRGEAKLVCHYCGELRNIALDKAALTLGADATVSGHNRDDIVRFLLNNYLKNDAFRIMAFACRAFPSPQVKEKCGYTNPVQLKPLAYLSEKEISLYCLLRGIDVVSGCCGYGDPKSSNMQGWRDDLTHSINYLETRHPGFSEQLMQNFETNIAPIFEKHIVEQGAYLDRHCVWCKKKMNSLDTDICLLCAECSSKIGMRVAETSVVNGAD